jgi:hypothetical protein
MTKFVMIPSEHFLSPNQVPLAVVGVRQGTRVVQRIIRVNLDWDGEIKPPTITTCYHRVALVPRQLKGVTPLTGDLCRLCVFEVAALTKEAVG